MVSGLNENQTENDGECVGADSPGKQGANNRADGGGDFKKHADADVGEALAHIGCRRARRSGDDRDQRGADGILDVDTQRESERGNHHDSAAKAGERAQKASKRGERPDRDCELEGSHWVSRGSFDRIRNPLKESENVRGTVFFGKSVLLSINSPCANS